MSEAKKQKVMDETVLPFWSKVLVADAREGTEPKLYYFSLQDAPHHMRREMIKNAEKDTYEFLSDADGAESLMGLVNVESEEAEKRAEEIWVYLDKFCVPENEFKPRIHKPINYSFTIAQS